jgi:FMNH2-dependent dimethyl sulfone monooxygenase
MNAGVSVRLKRDDGFKPRLIGTPEQIALRIQQYEAISIDILLGGFLNFIQDVENFGWTIRPLVRALPSLRTTHQRATSSSGVTV